MQALVVASTARTAHRQLYRCSKAPLQHKHKGQDQELPKSEIKHDTGQKARLGFPFKYEDPFQCSAKRLII